VSRLTAWRVMTQMAPDDEQGLVARLSAGDTGAFDEVYDVYRPRVQPAVAAGGDFVWLGFRRQQVLAGRRAGHRRVDEDSLLIDVVHRCAPLARDSATDEVRAHFQEQC
jgi:hypothetical protein